MGLVQRVSPIAVVIAAAGAIVGAVTAHASGDASPTLYVSYTNNCTFTITNDSGAVASTIAPGTYQVQVSTPQVFADVDLAGGDPNMLACDSFVQFQLTGPGVSISTTLQQGDEDFGTFSATFAPSSTYLAQDNNQPSVTRTTFTTSASGAPPTPGVPVSGVPAGSSSTNSGSSSSALGGSAASGHDSPAPLIGALTGSVSAAGKLTLSFKGKPVATLTAGRYTLTVTDKSKKSGFTIQGTGHPALTVTGTSFVGKRTASVSLSAGQWFFYPTFVGTKSYFIVVK
jgi:hypothetical protein